MRSIDIESSSGASGFGSLVPGNRGQPVGPRYYRMQILELVLSLVARLRDFGALNLVLNLVLAGSSFIAKIHRQRSCAPANSSSGRMLCLVSRIWRPWCANALERDSREQRWVDWANSLIGKQLVRGT